MEVRRGAEADVARATDLLSSSHNVTFLDACFGRTASGDVHIFGERSVLLENGDLVPTEEKPDIDSGNALRVLHVLHFTAAHRQDRSAHVAVQVNCVIRRQVREVRQSATVGLRAEEWPRPIQWEAIY